MWLLLLLLHLYLHIDLVPALPLHKLRDQLDQQS
uniref:Uncharacterized protein n=1 Tax=Picea glauca TaxID=3330 RepID=A0A101LWP2_PICGL|nr:hypothetical protein ABT39_MTgene1419 [Picea glauca]QHR92405.1 hypothetical protein Q903MT_gene6448 [Picea sitchensis]